MGSRAYKNILAFFYVQHLLACPPSGFEHPCSRADKQLMRTPSKFPVYFFRPLIELTRAAIISKGNKKTKLKPKPTAKAAV